MLILVLLGMYFDAAVVFVMKSSLFFRLAVAILWLFLCQDKGDNDEGVRTIMLRFLGNRVLDAPSQIMFMLLTICKWLNYGLIRFWLALNRTSHWTPRNHVHLAEFLIRIIDFGSQWEVSTHQPTRDAAR